MDLKEKQKIADELIQRARWIGIVHLLTVAVAILVFFFPNSFNSLIEENPSVQLVNQTKIEETDLGPEFIKDGVHTPSGLLANKGFEAVVTNCSGCHSLALVAQNRNTKKGWKKTIQWMQETQNLWDLGKNEEIIINYLATNYAPKKYTRRKPLENIEWYEIN